MCEPITTDTTITLKQLLTVLKNDLSQAISAIRMQPETLKVPKGMEDLYFPEMEPMLQHSIEHIIAAEARINIFKQTRLCEYK